MYVPTGTHTYTYACIYVHISTIVHTHMLWNLSITDTLGTDIFGHFLLKYRGFPLSEFKNVLVMPVRTKIFILRFFLNLEGRGSTVYTHTHVFKCIPVGLTILGNLLTVWRAH